MQQTWYVNGMLWGSTDTAVGSTASSRPASPGSRSSPKINGAGKVEGQVKKQGYLALANNNLTYPAIAMGANGKGVIAFTVVGEDYYPSAGYATIDADGSVGPIHIAAPASDRPTASRATRRSSATRRARVGATTAPP